MKIAILKFGGTSISTHEGREWAFSHVSEMVRNGYSVVIVVSAMGRMGDPYSTDTLISLVSPPNASGRDMDLLMSCGEIISSVVLSSFLNSKGLKTVPLTGSQAGIITDGRHGMSTITRLEKGILISLLTDGKIPVVTGFQGRSESGEVTTFGRGGSDLTAIALAHHLEAEIVEIYKDVNGVMTLDPKKSSDAKVIKKISAGKLLDMMQAGSQLMHQGAVRLAAENRVAFHLRNNFSPHPGTMVLPEPPELLEVVEDGDNMCRDYGSEASR